VSDLPTALFGEEARQLAQVRAARHRSWGRPAHGLRRSWSLDADVRLTEQRLDGRVFDVHEK